MIKKNDDNDNNDDYNDNNNNDNSQYNNDTIYTNQWWNKMPIFMIIMK